MHISEIIKGKDLVLSSNYIQGGYITVPFAGRRKLIYNDGIPSLKIFGKTYNFEKIGYDWVLLNKYLKRLIYCNK